MFKKLFFATAALALVSSPGLAADLPLKAPPAYAPAFSWTGCYVGANGGYGWGHNHSTLAVSADPASQAFFGSAFALGGVPPYFVENNRGGVAGGQVGCNQQYGSVVMGFETDLDWAGLKGSQTINLPNGTNGLVPTFNSAGSELQWLGTIRARIGYTPADHWLVYGTGGLAYGGVNYNTSILGPASNDFQVLSTTRTEVGWTIGAGVEWAFNNDWTFKAEYLYVDLGPRSNLQTIGSGRAADLTTSFTAGFTNQYQIVRAGVDYKFNWGAPVVAKY